MIGVDIDGVLSDTILAALKKAKKVYGVSMQFTDWTSWNPHHIEILRQHGIKELKDTVDFFYDIIREENGFQLYPIAGSGVWVNALRIYGKTLKALSWRDEDTRSWTQPWIHRHFPWSFSEVLLANTGMVGKDIPKNQFAKEHGIGLMIEDNAHYAIDFVTHDIPTILLKAPWNIQVDISLYPNIFRLNDWSELNKVLDNLLDSNALPS